uniref:Uncharacterized protein n=1 Tax=Panagrolaimus davidi TaxID=227884 RepID=A0A914P0X3_9BILA
MYILRTALCQIEGGCTMLALLGGEASELDNFDFDHICNNPEAVSWAHFKAFKYIHTVLPTLYGCKSTIKCGQFLSAFTRGFDEINDKYWLQNQIFYECVINNFKAVEESRKAQFWKTVIPPIIYSVILRMLIKVYLLLFVKDFMSRKVFFYVKIGLQIIDILFLSWLLYYCMTVYEQRLIERDALSFFKEEATVFKH